MFDLQQIQQALADQNVSGWLLYDFRGSNVLARRVLGLSEKEVSSRRFFYFIPQTGEPIKLVHRIESGVLDHLPGDKKVYLAWQELEQHLEAILSNVDQVAMEYAPLASNPYVARVDAGTIELIRRYVLDVISSGDLIQMFEASWSEEEWQLHLEAEKHTTAAFDLAWDFIHSVAKSGEHVEEQEVSDLIMDHFAKNGMTTYHPPIVAVNENSGNPHYETGQGTQTLIGKDSFVLLDLWAKMDKPKGVYSDLTRVAYVGPTAPQQYNDVFKIVAAARDKAISEIKAHCKAGKPVQGWQVDRWTRDVINEAGYGEYFIHRTGHSIGQETHGNGANMDDLETHEERHLLPGTCFSIEPGIYLPEFGIRSEVNVYIDHDNNVHVTGGPVQTEVATLG
ncbi:Aminopeptidase [Polystyrenella longa]|uniref:Aminopeptidase n=1 Tax=Polystyrenella longa TaxID=2528007 RepID=A0A518CIV2_9PLAN|nr:M24 family metallopeptidase [Polystyrenella longa]QDU79162.1 Aminopeptidase [Polystyrenella longa]